MSVCTKLSEPNIDDLTVWFKNAKHGDQCKVVTMQGELYTQLIKLSPFMVEWKVAGLTANDIDLSSKIRFSELAEIWGEVATG